MIRSNIKKHMKMKYTIGFFLVFFAFNSFSQKNKLEVERIDPPFWWVGMKNTQLQLIVKGKSISTTLPSISYPGVHLKEVVKLQSENYLFLYLEIDPNTIPGTFEIDFLKNGKTKLSQKYTLRKRNSKRKAQGLSQADVMYLIMPDRFANGDESNDSMGSMLEAADRNNPDGRHGGDLQGIIDNIDYFKKLGVTTIWLNPVLENNMPAYSYHGYAITDHYKVDDRFGGNEKYIEFIEKAHEEDLKVIMDMVFNHCGLNHFWLKDLPSKDWLNQWDEFTRTNYHNPIASDPHASNYDLKKLKKGWFDTSMPDLNQNNEHLSKYLIQNSIWWIENAGIDGIRMDTYPYPAQKMMNKWVDEVLNEYPYFYIVGETWVEEVSYESYWQKNSKNRGSGNYSSLPTISDFPIYFGVKNALKEDIDLYKLHDVLAQDFLYEDPYENKVFIDNHDVNRCFHELGEDLDKLKIALTFLLTTRGIPQFFYGTEILMKGSGPHGEIREDFPGGWKGDVKSVFNKEFESEDQEEIFYFVQKLLNWRKSSKAIESKNLVHFLPREGVYAYKREAEDEKLIVFINGNDKEETINKEKYKELFGKQTEFEDILSQKKVILDNELTIKPKSVLLLEVKGK